MRHFFELSADLLDQGAACLAVGLTALAALVEQGLDTGSSSADRLGRAAVEQPAAAFAGPVPMLGDALIAIGVRSRPAAVIVN